MVEEAKDNTGLALEAEGAVAAPVADVVESVEVAPEPIVPEPTVVETAAPVEAGMTIEPSPEKKKAGRPRKDAVKVAAEMAPETSVVAPAPVVVPVAVEAKAPVARNTRKAAIKPVTTKPVMAAKAVPAKAKPAKVRPVAAAPRKTPAVTPAKPATVARQPRVIHAAAPASGLASAPRKERFIMATSTTEFTEKFQSAFKDAGEKAKAAFEKSQANLGDVTDFAKGNVEAIVESSKILASGLQELGKGYVTEGKSAVESLTEELKGLASVKSPTEFFEKQSALLRKQFDAAVAASSKNSEAMLKLATEAFQPISTRVSLAVEKMKQAA